VISVRASIRRKTLGGLAAVCVLAVGGAAGLAATPPAKTPGLVAFVRSSGGPFGIYAVRPDGSGLRRLSRLRSNDLEPAWSPDGRRIAFASDQASAPSYDVFVMAADGSGAKWITRGLDAHEPVWSPDGKRIAFSALSGRASSVFVIPAEGGNVRRLTRESLGALSPSWSPDGRRIAFAGAGRTGTTAIYVMNADGSGVRQIARGKLADSDPAWSPDGRRIAFVEGGRGGGDLFVVGADGKGRRRLTDDARAQGPTWSPDGERIAYSAFNRTGNLDLYVMNADGSGVKQLTRSSPQDQTPAWQAVGATR
jgi:Tol biopolymer transport system component